MDNFWKFNFAGIRHGGLKAESDLCQKVHFELSRRSLNLSTFFCKNLHKFF